ncbi:hypothetical protein GCM10027436_84860 [Actinophytocola sediminis]
MRRLDHVHLERSNVDSTAAEGVEVEHVGEVGDRLVGLVRAVGGDEPGRGLARRVHRQPVRARVLRRRRMVAAHHGQRGEVGAVIGVQMGEQQGVQVERVAAGLQLGQRAVAEFDAEQEVVGLKQITGCGGARPRGAAGAAEDEQLHAAHSGIPKDIPGVSRR